MKRILLISGALLAAVSSAQSGEICGFAPLCGQADVEFDWTTGGLPGTPGELMGGAELNFESCCSLKDTIPQQSCEIVNPSGESYRTLTAKEPICGTSGADCADGTCSEYALIIDPTFQNTDSGDACCDSCSCFGDPECISMTGERNIFVLCDGREIPDTASMFNLCRITERRCEKELDIHGNTCKYLASDPKGRDWSVPLQGSPCIQDPSEPPAWVNMYAVPAVGFNIKLQLGDRGVITKVFLQLAAGNFTLDAARCLEASPYSSAWDKTMSGALPEYFSYNNVVEGRDVHWSVIDPKSGIAIAIRCYANYFHDDPAFYVPRINVEDLSDPYPRTTGTARGYCATSQFDYGLATTAHSQKIFDGQLCSEGLQDSDQRDIYRAICQNQALPASGQASCIYHFCSANYAPLFPSIMDCQNTFNTSLAEGFCKGITYTDIDAEKCYGQWFDLGALETIQQYYDDRSGCTNTVQVSLEKCQSGIVVQYYYGGAWVDAVAIPSDYCANNPITLSYCDYPRLFNRKLRIVQKAANAACGPVNLCTTISGFRGFIELTKDTPTPTQYPSNYPTISPTQYPTYFPSTSPTTTPPTPYPTTGAPTQYPVVTPNPTTSPTEFPSVGTIRPTPFPTGFPTQNYEECIDVPLCSDEPEYVEWDEQNDAWHIDMPGCCPVNPCPPELGGLPYQHREKGTEQWYCGTPDSDHTVDESFTKLECSDKFELDIMIMFSDDDLKCCKTCQCYGDPRCYSFDNEFSEFVLCDGRTPGAAGERCVIRKDTCLQQRDAEGHACAWTNPYVSVPDFTDAAKQAYEETKFEITKYGSPCRYNSSISGLPTLLMYQVDGYELEVQQGERGYIVSVSLNMANGNFLLESDVCLEGGNWETLSGAAYSGQFLSYKYGQEIVWMVTDPNTGINLRLRCTGTYYDGFISAKFINVESLEEPDDARISEGTGFCATGAMAEKRLATTAYTDYLTENKLCYGWNENTTPIMVREVARIVSNNQGVSNSGITNAFTTFCENFFSPSWSNVRQCVNAFMGARDVDNLISVFCHAVAPRELKECVENIQVNTESDGYQVAFTHAYANYVGNREAQCNVKFDTLPTTLDSAACQTGVTLEFYNPRKQTWVPYLSFPDSGACGGYTVTVNYKNHPKLFKNALRVQQVHDFNYCSSCTVASAMKGWFVYRQE